MSVDNCVVCGAIIPEGSHVCPVCRGKIKAIGYEKDPAYKQGYKVGADHHTRFTMAAFAIYMARHGYKPQQIADMVNGMTEIAAQYSTGTELMKDAHEMTGIIFYQ